MSSSLPFLLAVTFGASVVLALLDTGRWKIVLLCVIAVWGARLEPEDLALVSAGTLEAYARFALSTLGVWFPAIAVATIGSDLGAGIRELLTAAPSDGDEIAGITPHEKENPS